jgi:hypothetical protein
MATPLIIPSLKLSTLPPACFDLFPLRLLPFIFEVPTIPNPNSFLDGYWGKHFHPLRNFSAARVGIRTGCDPSRLTPPLAFPPPWVFHTLQCAHVHGWGSRLPRGESALEKAARAFELVEAVSDIVNSTRRPRIPNFWLDLCHTKTGSDLRIRANFSLSTSRAHSSVKVSIQTVQTASTDGMPSS